MRSGAIFVRSTKERQCSAKPSRTSREATLPLFAAGGGRASATSSSRNRRQSGIQRDRLRLRAREFHAVVRGRIVGCRDHYATVGIVLPDGEVERVRGDQSDIDDVRPGLRGSPREGLEEAPAGGPHIAAHHDGRLGRRASRAQQRHEAPADPVGDVIAHFRRINAPNVVGFENRGVYPVLHRPQFFDRTLVTPL